MVARIPLKWFIPVLLATTFIVGANSHAFAQDQRPEVEVDTSVLDDLGPARSRPPVTLKKPDQVESKRILTAISEPPADEAEQPFVPLKIVPPPGTVSHAPTDAVESPLSIPEMSPPPVKHKSQPGSAANDTVPARKPHTKGAHVEKFPITEKVRTDSINPAAPETAPAPAPDIATALSPAVPPPAAMPPAKPVRPVKNPAVPAKPAKVKPRVASKPAKPEVKSKPQRLVTKTIPSLRTKLAAPAMPSIPAAPVTSTTLSGDALARNLSMPDRARLARDIDAKNQKPAQVPAASKPITAPRANPDIVHTPAENVNGPTEKTASIAESKRPPRPPPSNPQEMNFFSVPCKAGVDELDGKVTSVLQAQVLPLLKDHPSWKLQIQSFASPTDNEPISARKVSLSRALAVRSWLLDKGLEPRRMEVRALGLETDRDPPDRLDMVLIDPDTSGG